MEGYIDITGVDPRKLIKEAYALSNAQGLGFIHYKDGDIPDQEIEAILERGNGRYVVSMDYVMGRAVKLRVLSENEKLFIAPNWYDHSQQQLQELLSRLGINYTMAA